MQDWEIGFVAPKDDYYFDSPEAQIAEYVRSDVNTEGMTSLYCSDVVVASSDDDYAILEGAYTAFMSAEWHPGRRDPSVIHGLGRVKKFGNLLVSTRMMAFILFYFERIASSRLYYFEGEGLACLADHLKETEDEFLNENDHLTKEAAELLCAVVRQDEKLQNQKLAELAEALDDEDEDFEDDFDEDDFIYEVAARSEDDFVYEIAGHVED